MHLANAGGRHRLLSRGPIGLWRTLPGTHTQLFDETIDFRADGSGELRTHSAIAGDRTLPFTWRMVSYGVVECRPIYLVCCE